MIRFFLFFILPLSTFAGIYEPHVLWAHKEIQVCFYDDLSQLKDTVLKNKQEMHLKYRVDPDEFSRKAKKRIKDVVLSEFSESETGISFHGWKDCSEVDDSQVDVRIIRSRGVPFYFLRKAAPFDGSASVGEAGVIDQNGYTRGPHDQKAYVLLTKLKKAFIVHEFGHIAGLRHEHLHPDSEYDKNCRSKFALQSFLQGILSGKLYSSTQMMTEYDSLSVMNYCHIYSSLNEIERSQEQVLSRLDRETLKYIYQSL